MRSDAQLGPSITGLTGQLLSSGLHAGSTQYLPGTQVRIVCGRLGGMVGEVVQSKLRNNDSCRCMVSVRFLNEIVALDMDIRLLISVES